MDRYEWHDYSEYVEPEFDRLYRELEFNDDSCSYESSETHEGDNIFTVHKDGSVWPLDDGCIPCILRAHPNTFEFIDDTLVDISVRERFVDNYLKYGEGPRKEAEWYYRFGR